VSSVGDGFAVNEAIDPRPPVVPAEVQEALPRLQAHGGVQIERVSDGWVVGESAGEFGGGLWYVADGTTQAQELAHENVRGLVEVSGKLFALLGYVHRGESSGRVVHVESRSRSGWQIEDIADLGAFPGAYQASGDSLYVVTEDGAFRILGSGAVEHLVETSFESLGPVSMAVLPTKEIVLGTKLFIVRLKPTEAGYVEEWYIPSQCADYRLEAKECICGERD
jgi:hypothetical protein